jgi:membrane protein YdbS with pleckstrin-like domain
MQKLDPKSVWFFFISSLLWETLIILFVLIESFPIFVSFQKETETQKLGFLILQYLNWLSGWLPLIIFVLILLLILTFVFARLSYHFYKYEFRDNGFYKEFGVIWKKYITIPYDRIQNVDIYRGVILRLLKLSEINIQTAGMGMYKAEARLPGLSIQKAEEIRDELLNRARRFRTQNENQGL